MMPNTVTKTFTFLSKHKIYNESNYAGKICFEKAKLLPLAKQTILDCVVPFEKWIARNNFLVLK